MKTHAIEMKLLSPLVEEVHITDSAMALLEEAGHRLRELVILTQKEVTNISIVQEKESRRE